MHGRHRQASLEASGFREAGDGKSLFGIFIEEEGFVAAGLGVAVFFVVAFAVAFLVVPEVRLAVVRLGVGLGVGVSVGREGTARASSE